MRKWMFAGALLALPGAALPNQAMASTAAPLLSHDLVGLPGQEGAVLRVELAPGEVGAVHRHNANVFVYMLSGTMVMQVAGGAQVTLHPGDTYYEAPTDIHAVSRNPSPTEPAKFIAFFVKTKGAPFVIPVP